MAYPPAFYAPRPQGLVTIGRPMLKVESGAATLSCPITFDGEDHEMWLSVPEQYAPYMVHERADAFLVVMLPLIARRGGKVRVEAPISAHLLHNLRHLLSPAMPMYSNLWHSLEIEAVPDATDFRSGGEQHVGCGCSCGVDSLATVLEYTEPHTPSSMRVDTLCFFNAGAHGCMKSEAERRALCEGRDHLMQAFADDIKVPLLRIDTNMQEFADGCWHQHHCSFRNTACVLSMQKYFAAYHNASLTIVSDFAFDAGDPAQSDEFLLRCLSTESTHFYSSLAIHGRAGRTRICAASPLAHRHLNVCLDKVQNCGRCLKCVRTMFMLELMGKLDAFAPVFDLAEWKCDSVSQRLHLASLLIYDNHFHTDYLQLTEEAEKKGVITRFSYKRLSFMFAHPRLCNWGIRQIKRLQRHKRAFMRLFSH